MKLYLSCLKENKSDHHGCRDQSKGYLQCRMDKDLMMKEDLNGLGFGDVGEYVRVSTQGDKSKEANGFISGTGVGVSRKFKW